MTSNLTSKMCVFQGEYMFYTKSVFLIFFSFFLIYTHVFAVANDTGITSLIAKSFLQERYKSVKSNNSSEKDLEKSFCNYQNVNVQLYNIKMTITSEQYDTARYVIIKTIVDGAPSDFQYQNVLETEAGLLKYILIRKYLDKLAEIKDPKGVATIVIDEQTKVSDRPMPYIVTQKMGIFDERQSLNETKSYMIFITIFSAAEFDGLAQKFLIDMKSSIVSCV